MDILDRISTLLGDREQRELTNFLGLKSVAFSEWKSGKSKSYRKYLIEIADFFNVSLDYLVYGKEPQATTNELTQNENELLEIFKNFDKREQVKIIGRMEEWLEVKHQREAISNSQRIDGVQVARRTDGKFVKKPVTAEKMEKIKALPEDTDY